MAAITLNTNLSALSAQRQLTRHSKSLGNSLDHLSSGLRINRAGDDAAGLAVSSLLNTDRRVFNQAVRNVNDGVSYLNVAEGAMNELTNVVTRIRELAEQSANGVLGSTQRNALQSEVTALENEYNRIVDSTSFNGNQLLTGTNTKVTLTGGYGTRAQLNVQVGVAAVVGAPGEAAGTTITLTPEIAGDYPANTLSISADGRYTVYSTYSSQPVSGDGNGDDDIFLRDALTGTNRLISRSTAGVQGDARSLAPQISADGRYVVYESEATNLIAGDTNGSTDIFRFDTLLGRTERMSVSTSGVEGDSVSYEAAVSADGRYVSFTSVASTFSPLEVGTGNSDIYLRDTLLGTTTLVSTTMSGAPDTTSTASSISADGRYVAFVSASANIVSGDTNGKQDVFVRDMLTGVTQRVSVATGGAQSNNDAFGAKISADGRYVTFQSNASNLVAGDTNGQGDIFVRDLLLGTTTRVSVGANGAQANSTSDTPSISADGRYIAFTSTATNLTYDASGTGIYVYDQLLGTTKRADLSTTGAASDGAATMGVISADGRYVSFLATAQNLTADSDGNYDLAYRRDLSTAGLQRIAGMVVNNQASARITMDLAIRYQDEISRYRGNLGAAISRASAFVSTLQTASENFASAAAQITDVDVAEESARLVSTRILQQGTAAILAQANRQPELALKLLGRE